METEQEDFEENIENLERTVQGFSAYKDLNKFEETAVDVESINQRLRDCIDQAKLYNQREYLVGKDLKDYSRLQGLNKEF